MQYDRPLSHYSAIGDEEAVRALLQRGVNVDEKNEREETALVCADFNKPIIVKLLLDAGADLNAANYDLQRPLHLAVMKNSLESVKLLIQAKADVHVEDNYCKIPLNYAIKIGSSDIVKVLLEVTQRFEISDINLAVKSGNEEIVKLLLDCNIDVNDETLNGDFPLYIASCQPNLNVTRLLLDYGANVDKRHRANDDTALHQATKMGCIEQMKLLLQRGANVHMKTSECETALHYATRRFRENTYDIVKLLIQHGANCNDLTIKHISPLGYALIYCNRQINELLLEHGANLNVNTSNGQTALHYAILNSHVDVINLLLDIGLDINARDVNDCTALYIAIEIGLVEVCELLLDKGADIDPKSLIRTQLSFILNMPPNFSLPVPIHYFIGLKRDYVFLCKLQRIKNLLVKHIAKLKFQSVPVDKQNEKIINDITELKGYYLLCMEELRKIEKYQILNDFSLFQLLFQSKNNIIRYVKNEEFVRAYESSTPKLQENFPIYFTDYFRKYFEDQITKQRQIKKTIDKLCNIFHTNYVVSENIVKYLKAKNLDYINNINIY